MSIPNARLPTALAALAALSVLLAAPPIVSAQTASGNEVPVRKRTTLGLYVTAAEAYEMWLSAPDKVKVIDVRTPEEYAFVGHPEMSWNIPIAFVTYQRVTCRSGGRSAMAVNALAAAGFKNAYNIVDGVEGDLVHDPDSVFDGKRMKNGWKNSAPWVYRGHFQADAMIRTIT
jgi:rhodanese-related sulfurtransferase